MDLAAMILRGANLEWLALMTMALFIVGVVVLWKRPAWLANWPVLGTLAVILLGVAGWLAIDDPKVDYPVTLAEISPAPAKDAAAGYAATLWFTEVGGKPAAHTVPDGKFHLKSSLTEKPEKWGSEIAANREMFAAELAALAPAREWLAELDRFAELGDMPAPDFAAPMIKSGVFNRVVGATCVQAGLLALDGHGDEAFEAIRPALSVALKLERHGRSDLRMLLAARAVQNCVSAAQFVLAHAPVSAEARARLAQVAAQRDALGVVHRVAWLPYTLSGDYILKHQVEALDSLSAQFNQSSAWLMRPLVYTHKLWFLPNRTANSMARFALAAEQQLSAPGAAAGHDAWRAAWIELTSTSPKNLGGRAIIAIAVPNYERMGQRLEATEKSRLALLAALSKS
ncbi:MAG: hypothetical protein PSW75_12495 [bacterium]|nr:hypothetical protein [bacterium]